MLARVRLFLLLCVKTFCTGSDPGSRSCALGILGCWKLRRYSASFPRIC